MQSAYLINMNQGMQHLNFVGKHFYNLSSNGESGSLINPAAETVILQTCLGYEYAFPVHVQRFQVFSDLFLPTMPF
jgi:hypothetical protein